MAYKNIAGAMKWKQGIRITFDDKWLIWCDSRKTWELYRRKKHQKLTRLIFATRNESDAINELVDA